MEPLWETIAIIRNIGNRKNLFAFTVYKEFKLFLNILMWRKMLQVPSKNLHIALLSGVWASAKPLSDRVGVVRGLVVVTTVSCRQLGTLSSLLPGGEVE